MPDCKHTSFNKYNMPVLSTINVLVVIWFAMPRTLVVLSIYKRPTFERPAL